MRPILEILNLLLNLLTQKCNLNPLSRTVKTADITMVDNVVRAINRLISESISRAAKN